ncbi:hypothetical protein ACFZAM_03055 [Streptomyces sp. NPDC008079]|uniref:hypothetical protein n=1 Tax=Streptomyces sp. NPDC008079 TaxID=3364806 RepID=UPI0036E6B51C
MCEATFADITTPGATLVVNVSSEEDRTTHLVIWEGNDGRDLLRTTNRADAVAFATNLRELADAVERGAALLALDAARRIVPAGRRLDAVRAGEPS